MQNAIQQQKNLSYNPLRNNIKDKKNAAIPKTFIHIIPDKKIFKKEINKFHKIDFNLQRQIPFRLLLLKSVKKISSDIF